MAPADHRWHGRTEVSLEQLAREPIVLREPGSGTRGVFESAIADRRPEGVESLNIAAELGSTTAVKEAVLDGLGVGIVSTRALVREIETGSLISLRLAGIDMQRSIDCVVHHRRTISPVAQSFMDHLLAACGS